MQRYILVIYLGLTPDEAVEYTLHSWRHWYATATKQLKLFTDQQEAIGHWAKGSSMPAEYDMLNNSLEVAAKSYIQKVMLKGWDLVEAGKFPRDAPAVSPREPGHCRYDQSVSPL